MWNLGDRRPEGPADRCDTTGKVRYRTDKLALLAAIGFKRRKTSNFRRSEKPLHVFYCGDCDGWHLGHRMRNGRNG